MPKKSISPKKSLQLPLIILVPVIVTSLILGLKAFISKPTIPTPIHINSPKPIKNITGIYKGELPCADCPGIEETLTLAGTEPEKGTYIMENVYKEKSTAPFRSQGTWEKISDSTIKLTDSKNPEPNYFQITTGSDLIMLNSKMQKIDSPFNQTLTHQN